MATLTANPTGGTVPLPVTFVFNAQDPFFVAQDTALNPGDGSAVQHGNLQHTYQTVGLFTATVTAQGTSLGISRVYSATTIVNVTTNPNAFPNIDLGTMILGGGILLMMGVVLGVIKIPK